MTKTKITGSLMLILCTIIWGCAFSFQAIAAKYIGPFFLIGIRFLIAGIILTPFVIFRIQKNKMNIDYKVGVLGGILIGFFLGTASVVQQFGIERTTAGKAGFLTAMYIVFVPIVSFLIFRKKTNLFQIIGILITVVGVGLMSLTAEFRMNLGDFLCLICGILFSFQIMSVDFFSRKTDSIFLAMVSFYTCGILSLIFGAFFETITLDGIKATILPILYLGIGSSCIAYSLQILGQKRLSGVPAALIMSLEAVFSAIFAWIMLHEVMSTKELFGAILMMIGVVLVQVYDGRRTKQMKNVYIFPFEDSLDRPNLVYIKGDKKSLLIDAGGGPKTYQYILGELQKNHLQYPDYVLLTHYHWDHMFGIGYFNCETLASKYTNEQIRRHMELNPKNTKDLISDDYQPLFCLEHLLLEYGDTLKELKLKEVIRCISHEYIDLGNRELEILEVPSPHTEGSLIVYDKRSDTLFIGDADYGYIVGMEFYDSPEKKKEFLDIVEKIHPKYILKGHSHRRTYEEYMKEEK